MPEKNTIKLKAYTKRKVIVNVIMTKSYAITTKVNEALLNSIFIKVVVEDLKSGKVSCPIILKMCFLSF